MLGVKSSGPDDHTEDTGTGPQLSPALVATLATIPVVAIVIFIAYAALRPDSSATPVDSYPAQPSAAPECGAFLGALPETFTGFGTKRVVGDRATWPARQHGDPVTVRCGIARPAGLSATSNLQVVDPVQWFITDSVDGSGQAFVCVDHRPYVALWIPVDAGNGPITDVSAVIERTLARGPLDFG
ncbi:MAG: DUF3515 domain-containing protein [Gordonia sp. (in: high G+C Gram-positive bacteria)]